MAKKSTPPAARRAPSISDPGELLAPEIEREQDQLSAAERAEIHDADKIFSILNGERMREGKIYLQRRRGSGDDFASIGKILVTDWAQQGGEDLVREVYGGGEYRAQAKTQSGGIVHTWTFKVDASIPMKSPDAAPAPVKNEEAENLRRELAELKARLAAPAAPAGPSVIDVLLPLLLASQKQNSDMMTAFLTRPAVTAPAVDPQILTALSDLRREVSDMKTQKVGNPFSDLLKLREVMDELRPDEPEKVSVWENVGKGIAAGLPMLAAQFGMTPPGMMPAAPQSAIGDGAQPNPTPQPTPQGNEPTEEENPMIRDAINRFRVSAVNAARGGQDPREFMTATLASIPEMFRPMLYNAANKSSWFADIFGADPDAARAVEWLREMRGVVLESALVAFVKDAHGKKKTPGECAASALDSFDPGFHSEIWNLTEPGNWKESFQTVAIDVAWLESLRLSFDKLLGDEPAPTPGASAAKP